MTKDIPYIPLGSGPEAIRGSKGVALPFATLGCVREMETTSIHSDMEGDQEPRHWRGSVAEKPWGPGLTEEPPGGGDSH